MPIEKLTFLKYLNAEEDKDDNFILRLRSKIVKLFESDNSKLNNN